MNGALHAFDARSRKHELSVLPLNRLLTFACVQTCTVNIPARTEPKAIHSHIHRYEKRVIELLRNSKDKRARRLAKKRVR